MNKSVSVFHMQLALFRCEKGMHLFYVLCIAIAGILLPVFFQSLSTSLTLAGLLTVMFLKPILSDSLAGEREKKTLESLLSTPMDGKSIIWGKFLFGIFFGISFFGITILCTVLTKRIAGHPLNMMAWQWICALLLPILCFAAISIAGAYASARSGDTRIANGRLSRIAYPLGLLLMLYFPIVFLGERTLALLTGLAAGLLCLCTAIMYMVKVSKMKQAGYFENIKTKGIGKANKSHASAIAPKSQFAIVFRHEMRSLLTLKTMLLSFLLLCFAPAIVVGLVKHYTGEVNLYFAVLLTALMMPRTPANLIAYSIGGEKVYKTGESLLSTPLHVRPLFLAKSMIPVLVSAIMLALSSLLSLAMANVIGRFLESGIFYRYTIDQLVLLFPVGVVSCITMVFITGLLSVNRRTPRQGLYVSSVLGILFVFPPLAIVYLAHNRLIWSLLYFAVLLLCNAVCVVFISDKMTRPQIMSRL